MPLQGHVIARRSRSNPDVLKCKVVEADVAFPLNESGLPQAAERLAAFAMTRAHVIARRSRSNPDALKGKAVETHIACLLNESGLPRAAGRLAAPAMTWGEI